MANMEEVLGARVGGEISATSLEVVAAERPTGCTAQEWTALPLLNLPKPANSAAFQIGPRLLGPWLSGRVVGLDLHSIYF
jgi:hypothetical protein